MPAGTTKEAVAPVEVCSGCQVVPELRLYCHLPPMTRPLTLIVPSLVIQSLLDLPVSLLSSSDGALGANVSTQVLAGAINTEPGDSEFTNKFTAPVALLGARVVFILKPLVALFASDIVLP